MRQPCPTDQRYPNDPQDEPLDPTETNCGYCGRYINVSDLCEISTSTSNAIYCCPDCFDEVCDEEGINPQTMEKLS